MSGSFDPILVALSFLVAVAASYTALELARRLSATSGLAAGLWLAAGAASMGIGIWTMHFVGMLAFSMDMPFGYDVTLTALSLLVGIAASAFAIFLGSLKSVSNLTICLSGIILGAGIASMHYLGMAAMIMPATIHYDTFWVATSIAIAIVAATAAIWIAFTLAHKADHGLFKLKLMAATIMGIAICGMHYTGMIAASYEPLPGTLMDHSGPVQQTWLAVSLALAALIILGFTHLTIFYDYRLTAQQQIVEQAESEAFRLSEILDDSSNEIYLFATDTLKFVKVNKGAAENLGYPRDHLYELTPVDLNPEFTHLEFTAKIKPLRDGHKQDLIFDTVHRRADGSTYPVSMHLQLSKSSTKPVFVAFVADITERKNLEGQFMQSKKLESIGQLAAGIAHEINTPAQYVGDNIRFLRDAFDDLLQLVGSYEKLHGEAREKSFAPDLLDDIAKVVKQVDPEYLAEEIPVAAQQSEDGINRISKIVLAMKEFSHPGGSDKEMVDLNKNIANTLVVASNEWKYVANVVSNLDESLPSLPCHPQEISQVMLNLIVNAAHAIDEKNGGSTTEKGEITISTRTERDNVEIRITDTGSGIPVEIRERIFDPFFTTKEVGKGTGQGLSMAYATIVEKHQGSIVLESEVGRGTTFIITLPLRTEDALGQAAVA